MSGSFHVNPIISCPVVLDRTDVFKQPHLFLNVYDYLPFDKDLALYLKKLEFPLRKDDLYQV
jgi:hypothetical protein